MGQETYQGGCHCGDIRYKVTVDLTKSVACNCSICSKKGYILTFAPASSFELLKGEGKQTDYRFNKHAISHLFCKRCGVTSFARGTSPGSVDEMAAINVRCLDGVDLTTLTPKHVDGKSF